MARTPPPTFTTTTWIPGQCWFNRFAPPAEPRCPKAGLYGYISSTVAWTRRVRWCAQHKSYQDRLIDPVSE